MVSHEPNVSFGAFFLFLAGLAAWAATLRPWLAPWLGWVAIALTLTAAGYLGLGASVVAKRPDGTIPWWRGVLLFPYLLWTWTVWWLYTVLVRENVYDEIAPTPFAARGPSSRGMRTLTRVPWSRKLWQEAPSG